VILLVINNDGWISVNNRFVKGDELEPLLTEAHRKDSDTTVVIKSYNLVTMDRIKFVMDVCRSAGIPRFGLECMTVIDCDRDGAISFNRGKITDVRLESLLNSVRNVDANAQILIQYCDETPLKKLAIATDACRTAGLHYFVIQQR
jgi:biopolymer transport protein ExbD